MSNSDNSTVRYNSKNLLEVTKYFDASNEKRIALIGPTENISEDQKKSIDDYISKQKENHNQIYYPSYHTDQNDNIGLITNRTNGKAINKAGRVAISE